MSLKNIVNIILTMYQHVRIVTVSMLPRQSYHLAQSTQIKHLDKMYVVCER